MKKHIKLILRTLFSNNACVEAARTPEKKYTIIAIVFLFLSLFLAALPTCVTGFKQKGGDFIRGANYGFDTAMIEFKKATDGNVNFAISKDSKHRHYLNTDVDAWKATFQDTSTACTVDLYRFTCDNGKDGDEKHNLIEIYYCDKGGKEYTNFVNDVVLNMSPYGDHNKNHSENWLETTEKKGKTVRKDRHTSFIVFGKYSIQAAIYAPGSTSISSSVYGDYGNTKPNTDFINNVLVRSTTNINQVIKDCAKFFDQVFVNPRRTNTWRSTGIVLGVDAGVVLLMGFMVWVLTRGKNNPFRIYTIWDGQKIAYYACFTPGLLALFGFLMTNLAMMLYILGVGVRVMWLSMRTLRYQAPAKQ